MTEEFILKVVGIIGASVVSAVLATVKDETAEVSPQILAAVLEFVMIAVILNAP